MRYKLLFLAVSIFFIGCGGENKLKLSGTLTKHYENGNSYFTIKDDKTGKLYQISKKSESLLSNKENHKIKMAAKILEKDANADGVETIVSCTKCHHSVKEL